MHNQLRNIRNGKNTGSVELKFKLGKEIIIKRTLKRGKDKVQQALKFSHYLRNRFTVSVLGRVLRMW